MIYIVHGNNTAYTRNIILNQQKKLGIQSRKEYAISEITPEELIEACLSIDLFGVAPFLVLDISQAGRKNLDDYIEAVKKVPDETTLIVMSSKELTKTNSFIKNLADLKAKLILSPEVPSANVFKFISSVFSGNRNKAYQELINLLKENQEPIYLFSMILYGLRNIAYAAFDSPSLNKMAPFAKVQAKKQASSFSKEKVMELFSEFYIIDKQMKTGEILPEIGITVATEKILNNYVRTEELQKRRVV